MSSRIYFRCGTLPAVSGMLLQDRDVVHEGAKRVNVAHMHTHGTSRLYFAPSVGVAVGSLVTMCSACVFCTCGTYLHPCVSIVCLQTADAADRVSLCLCLNWTVNTFPCDKHTKFVGGLIDKHPVACNTTRYIGVLQTSVSNYAKVEFGGKCITSEPEKYC